ncbi:hypothetical protein KR222_006576, partial [Zaprionus bogoriensis]
FAMCIEKARTMCPQIMNRQLLQLLGRQLRGNSNSCASPAVTPIPPWSEQPALLSESQRDRCMTELRNLPAYQRPKTLLMPHNKREKSAAAVLIALCVDRETKDVCLLYTRRSRHLRSHSLQISFPGGKRDEEDSSFTDCALRETEEEIGLPRYRIELWGESNPIVLPRTNSIVPVVGVVQDFNITQLKLNPDEVEEAFAIPIRSLILPTSTRHTQFRSGYSGPVFAVHPHRIWGITGYLTHVFLRCFLPKDMTPHALKTSIKFIRPYKLAPKLVHHHVEPKASEPSGK